MTGARPTIAVGVCTYNRGARITDTLESLARQKNATGRFTRVIIVNNNSSDDTAAVVGRFIAARAPGLLPEFVLLSEPRAGKTNAMRTLFTHARDPALAPRQSPEGFVCIVDDDILLDEDWTDAVLGLIDAHPDAGAVGGPIANVWERSDGTTIPEPLGPARVYRKSLGDQDLGPARHRIDEPSRFLMGAAVAYGSEAVRACRWVESPILDTRRGKEMATGEDAELVIRVRQAGFGVYYEPTARARHLIPQYRQEGDYLSRLRECICRSEPWLDIIARYSPWPESDTDRAAALEHAQARLREARGRYYKTLLTNFRPTRRRFRLAERLGTLRGWEQVCSELATQRGE